jgi:hypothetical protein
MARCEQRGTLSRCQSCLLVFRAMACRRCGCRMLTKVGRTTPMLICTDCGLPVDQRESAALKRKRLWGALTLVCMAVMGGAILLLASINEIRREGGFQDAERQTEASSEEGEKDEQRLLLEPSRLVDPQRPATDGVKRSTATTPVKGQAMRVSAQPGAVEAQEKKEP